MSSVYAEILNDNPQLRVTSPDGSYLTYSVHDNGIAVHDGFGNKDTLIEMVKEMGKNGDEIVFLGRPGWHRVLSDLHGFETDLVAIGRYTKQELQ